MMNVKEKYVRWVGIFVFGFFLSFFIEEHQTSNSFYHIIVTILFTAILWNGCYFIIYYFRKKYADIAQTARRLVSTFIWVSVFLIVGKNLINLGIGFNSISDLNDMKVIFHEMEISLISSIFVSSIYESIYFFSMWTEAVRQNEALKNQQMKTQFEVLQNQMSPHFLFNSLNTLTTLIAENQELAISFTQELSQVYRYILQNKEKELVKLEVELDFAKSYVYLLQIRYPNNLTVSFSIPNAYKNYYIAPLTLQILIENAIKHNIISKHEPLEIKVFVENDAIIVSNNLQIKNTIDKSTKTGLENIKKRYAIMGNRKIDVIESENNFTVAVPMIKVINEFDYLKETKA